MYSTSDTFISSIKLYCTNIIFFRVKWSFILVNFILSSLILSILTLRSWASHIIILIVSILRNKSFFRRIAISMQYICRFFIFRWSTSTKLHYKRISGLSFIAKMLGTIFILSIVHVYSWSLLGRNFSCWGLRVVIASISSIQRAWIRHLVFNPLLIWRLSSILWWLYIISSRS